MEVPEGFDKFYDRNKYILKLLKTIYGLKQSAMAFWKKLLKCFCSMGYSRCRADPCLYYKWTTEGLIIWISWIDNCLVLGPNKQVKKAKKELTS